MAIILASKSPRRQELMRLLGLEFTIHTADVDETMDKTLPPEQEVVRGTLADIAEKAAHIKKTALILVGNFLRESDKRSKLYDPAFAHACREAETP